MRQYIRAESVQNRENIRDYLAQSELRATGPFVAEGNFSRLVYICI